MVVVVWVWVFRRCIWGMDCLGVVKDRMDVGDDAASKAVVMVAKAFMMLALVC